MSRTRNDFLMSDLQHIHRRAGAWLLSAPRIQKRPLAPDKRTPSKESMSSFGGSLAFVSAFPAVPASINVAARAVKPDAPTAGILAASSPGGVSTGALSPLANFFARVAARRNKGGACERDEAASCRVMEREDFNVDSKMQERMRATAGEMITIWYAGTKANERVPFRAKVLKASQKHGMHIEHIDLEADDPRKEDWLSVESKNWLIGDWHTYSSKDAAQEERAARKADEIATRLRQAVQGNARSKEAAQAAARSPARARPAVHQHAH